MSVDVNRGKSPPSTLVQKAYGKTMSEPRPFKRAHDLLTHAGLRPTRQRLALARLLFDRGDRHVTAEQLHSEAVAANMPVSLATVYNTLHQLTHTGLLREVVVETGRSYFDTNVSAHHHFFHESSGHLTDIPGDAVQVVNLPSPPTGTRVRQVEVIIRVVEDTGDDKSTVRNPRGTREHAGTGGHNHTSDQLSPLSALKQTF